MRNLLFLSIMFLSLFCSCNNNDIESDATEHLKSYMKETLFHPDQAELINTHTTYKSDSLCIIQCTLKAPNNNGDILSCPIEYIYIDAMLDGKKIKAETLTAIGDDFISKDMNGEYMKDGEKEDEKKVKDEWNKEGYDVYYIANHSVAKVKEKYRANILKHVKYKANDPHIEDRLTFSAAWLKIGARGREISDEKGKDIKL